MKYAIIALLPLMALLAACGGGSTSPNDSFSCSVTLRNADGEPLSDYRVQLASSDNIFYGRPETVISFDLIDYGDDAICDIIITDYWDTVIDTVFSGPATAGNHCIAWNGCDTEGNSVSSGVYQCVMTVTDGGEVVANQSLYMLLLHYITNCPEGLTTDDSGQVKFTDITPLPGLYCEEELIKTDEQGNVIGYFEFTPDSFIVAQSPEGEVRKYSCVMTDGANSFSLVWEEMDFLD